MITERTVEQLLTGNQAIALAARDAGAALGVGYPGTPSTEVLESLALLEGALAQWAPNEKVALEVGIGVAFAGKRALVTMKHVGLNVAADPLFTVSYTGVRGGLVIMVADDPGMHSSQNEQDSRHYARAAKLPMLEPADSQEAYTFTRQAFRISEQFGTPVLIRTTTRLSHGKSLVVTSEPDTDLPGPTPPDDPSKYVMIPAFARRQHHVVEDRLQQVRDWAEVQHLTHAEYHDTSTGIVTSGIAYQYVRDIAPEASVLKLGMVYPLPMSAIRKFAARVDRLIVAEELDPFIEDQLRAAGLKVMGKEMFPLFGEFTPAVVARSLGRMNALAPDSEMDLPLRPPTLCPSCPHRSVFRVLKKLGATVSGDIGCYTLGVMAPLQAIDTCVCMGASIGVAHGLEIAGIDTQRVVGVIGDSTFMHSGITGLLNMVANGSRGTVLILDNSITAMTGRQHHPGTGKNLMGETTPKVDLVTLVRALGVTDVDVVDPYDVKAMEARFKQALTADTLTVLIVQRPCMLIPHEERSLSVFDPDRCRYCGACLKLGCPAITREMVVVNGRERYRPVIDPQLCRGCGVCVEMCAFGALQSQEAEP